MRDPTVTPDLSVMYSTSFVTNAMPVRRATSQNLTGLYLGIEGGRDPPRARQSIPPLARGRGKPSHRPKTPVEHRRYRTVERNRVKDENFQVQQGMKGFSGNIKTRARGVRVPREASPEPESPPQFPVTFTDIIRQTDRHFTAMTNDGVTRFEKLNRSYSPTNCPDYCPRAFSQTPAEVLAHEVERGARTNCEMLGLTECYKKICKGSVESLYTLLPPKKTLQRLQKSHKPNRYTGFSVKSYRNPNSADIIACFPEHRAKTVLGVFTSGSRVHYTPHYFKYFSPMYTPMPISAASPMDIDANAAGRPLGAPALLQQMPIKGGPVVRRLQNTPCTIHSPLQSTHAWTFNAPQDLAPVTSVNSEVEETAALLEGIPSQPAPADIVEQHTPVGTTETPPEVDANAAKTGTETELETEMAAPGGRSSRLVKTPSGADIKIGLEDESGEQKPVEIDVADPTAEVEADADDQYVPETKRKISITERVFKMRNSEEQLQSLADDAETRKKELASLLDEHAHLVEQVSTMEVHRGEPASPGSDKENKTFKSSKGNKEQ